MGELCNVEGCKEKAKEERDQAVKKIHKEFAVTNDELL